MTRTRRLALALYLLAFWVAILLPFDFHWPGPILEALRDRLARSEWSTVELLACGLHAVFFLPFGVLIEGELAAGALRKALALILAVVALALLSEFSQLFVSRGTSIGDLSMDLLGAALGYVLGRHRRRSPALQALATACLSPRVLLGGIIAFLAAIALLLVPLDTGFGSWDRSFPLLAANEEGRSRPWQGEIYEVAILDRALGPAEACRLTESRASTDLAAALKPIVHYTFLPSSLARKGEDVVAITDDSAFKPPVNLYVKEPSRVLPIAGGGIAIAGPSLITSLDLPLRFHESLQGSAAMSLLVRFQARDPDAAGPARIISLSGDTARRNFTLAQERSALHFRLRNAIAGENGTSPELVAPACVRPGSRQAAAAVCAAGSSRLYVDGEFRAAVYYTGLYVLERLVFHFSPTPAARAGYLVFAWVLLVFLYHLFLQALARRRGALSKLWPGIGAPLLAAATLGALLAVNFWLKMG